MTFGTGENRGKGRTWGLRTSEHDVGPKTLSLAKRTIEACVKAAAAEAHASALAASGIAPLQVAGLMRVAAFWHKRADDLNSVTDEV